MSTPKKKPQQPAAPDSKPKYKLGDKLFFVDTSGSRTIIRVGKVDQVNAIQNAIKDEKGRVTGKNIMNLYLVVSKGREYEKPQGQLYPSFQLVANAFSKLFLESDK